MEKTVSYGGTKYTVKRDGDKIVVRYRGSAVGHVVPVPVSYTHLTLPTKA